MPDVDTNLTCHYLFLRKFIFVTHIRLLPIYMCEYFCFVYNLCLIGYLFLVLIVTFLVRV